MSGRNRSSKRRSVSSSFAPRLPRKGNQFVAFTIFNLCVIAMRCSLLVGRLFIPSTGIARSSTRRTIAETATGIGMGDLLISTIGTGPWQIALVVVLAMSTAILLDGGSVITMQSANSAVLVATLYIPAVASQNLVHAKGNILIRADRGLGEARASDGGLR